MMTTLAPRKYGGRVKGTPNKRTLDIQQRLYELGCDPIEGMAKLALDTNNPPELRARMFAELAQYVAPKRKAIEVTADFSENRTVQLVKSSNELLAMIRGGPCFIDNISNE